jgi:hypothetical protein
VHEYVILPTNNTVTLPIYNKGDCKKSGAVIPLKFFWEARDNASTFQWFCENYLSTVMGKTKYSKNKDKLVVSKMSTASDEALVILCVENSHARWVWEHEKQTAGEETEKPKPMYTDSSNKAYKYGGWTEKGIDRYNELTGKMIPALRKKTEEVERDLREIYIMDAQDRSGKRKHKEVSNKKVVVAIYEPSSDEEEGEEYQEDDPDFQERGSNNNNNDN